MCFLCSLLVTARVTPTPLADRQPLEWTTSDSRAKRKKGNKEREGKGKERRDLRAGLDYGGRKK